MAIIKFRSVLFSGVAGVILGFQSHAVFAQQSLTSTFEVQAQCKKVNTDGCTDHIDHNWACKSAPFGTLIVKSTASVASIRAHGKQAVCRKRFENVRNVKTPYGTYEFSEKICVGAHIESGGGARDMHVTFSNTCQAKFEIVPTPQP